MRLTLFSVSVLSRWCTIILKIGKGKEHCIPSKRIEVALVRFGLGGGYEFSNGILVVEQSYITLGSLPDMDNLPYFRQKDMGYWGEWEVALSGGYRIKFSPLVNTLPYVGMVYTSRYEFLKGVSSANDSAKLEWGVLGKDKFGGIVGLSLNYKKWEARFEADIATRKFFVAQVGVKIWSQVAGLCGAKLRVRPRANGGVRIFSRGGALAPP